MSGTTDGFLYLDDLRTGGISVTRSGVGVKPVEKGPVESLETW